MKNLLNLLGFPEYSDTVLDNNIVREIGINEKNHTIEYEILGSFESNSQAKETLILWHNEFEDFCQNYENYK